MTPKEAKELLEASIEDSIRHLEFDREVQKQDAEWSDIRIEQYREALAFACAAIEAYNPPGPHRFDIAEEARGAFDDVPLVDNTYLHMTDVNEEAFRETVRSGYATYWSRSRQELWKKGLTSGDMLKIDDILINCEQNSFVYLVTPQGKGACHAKKEDGNPHKSCYYRSIVDGSRLRFNEK